MDSSGWLAVPGAVGIGGARARRKGPPPQARRRADTCPRPSDYLVVSSRDRGHMVCLGPRNIPQAGGPWPADTQTCHRSHSGLGGAASGGRCQAHFQGELRQGAPRPPTPRMGVFRGAGSRPSAMQLDVLVRVQACLLWGPTLPGPARRACLVLGSPPSHTWWSLRAGASVKLAVQIRWP